MKVKIEKEKLVKIIEAVQGSIASNSALPILTHILLSTHTSSLIATATNNESTTVCAGPAIIENAGKVCVPGKKFQTIIKNLPDDTIDLCLDNSMLKVKAGSSEYSLFTLPADDFPYHEQITPDKCVIFISNKSLKSMIDNTKASMAPDQSRPNLNGILIQSEEPNEVDSANVELVATDGKILSFDLKPASVYRQAKIIVPSNIINIFQKLLNPEEKLMTHILLDDERSAFMTWLDDDISLYLEFKVISGNYPDWKKVVPRDMTEHVAIPPLKLAMALSRILGINVNRQDCVDINLSGSNIELSANSETFGSGKEIVPLSENVKPFQFCVNPTFMIEPLLQAKEELNVTLNYNPEKKSQVLLKIGEYPQHIIMTIMR